jgi:hypothetical protein
MEDWQKGYVLVVIALNEDDTPSRSSEEVAADIAAAGIKGVVEARPAAHDGLSFFWPYGSSVIA